MTVRIWQATAALLVIAPLAAAPALSQQAGPSQDQQAATGQRETTQELGQLAQDAIAAQQMGNLAADKDTRAGYQLLGDQMSLTNAQINKRLDQLAKETRQNVPRTMDAQSKARFEELKATNQERFAEGFVRFIDETYPRMIQNIEDIAKRSPESPAATALANEALPALRDQMQTARQLAQSGGDLNQQKAESINRGPIERKDDPRVMKPNENR
ncbi:MAG: DUF4142 domain-containing protein [Solirubrobacterales bacterium]